MHIGTVDKAVYVWMGQWLGTLLSGHGEVQVCFAWQHAVQQL